MDHCSRQRISRGNVLKGNKTTDLSLEFCLLQEKAAAFTARRRRTSNLGEQTG